MGDLSQIQNLFGAPQQGSIIDLLINVILATVSALLLRKIYIKYARSLSNKTDFANNFVILALTTMMIITVIKSSLALSLGLVGALSIIRFRAAIKEPEELAYIFLTISIGLGFGAEQRYVTLLLFSVIALIIIIKGTILKSKGEHIKHMYLTVTSLNPSSTKIESIVQILKENASMVYLKRLDETSESLEALFWLDIENLEQLNTAKDAIKKLDKSVSISFLDNS